VVSRVKLKGKVEGPGTLGCPEESDRRHLLAMRATTKIWLAAL
jgi:hypothetical protein